MAKLSQDQMRQLANRYGADWNSALMAAIGMAESGGDPNVINSIGATGLWQIYWKVWANDPEIKFITKGNQHALLDPGLNAAAAHRVFMKQGYNAWTTYTSGAYKKYYNGDIGAQVGTQVSDAGATAVSPVATAAQGVGEWVGALTETLRKLGLNAGALIVGLVLLILGVVILSRSELGTAVKTVAKVA